VSASSGQKPQLWANFDIFGGSCTDPLLPMRDKFGVLVYSVVLWQRKTPIFAIFFAVFWISAFSDVANWHQSQKVEHECRTTNLPLSKGIKIVSVLQRLHDEIGRTNSDVQKHDGHTDRQTDKKTQRFWPPRRQVKSEPHQTWRGDRGPRARSCTSKTPLGSDA